MGEAGAQRGVGAPGTPLLVGRVPHELGARLGLPYRSGVLSSQGRQLQVVRMQRVERPTTIAITNKEKDEGSHRVHGTFLTKTGEFWVVIPVFQLSRAPAHPSALFCLISTGTRDTKLECSVSMHVNMMLNGAGPGKPRELLG